MEIERQATCQQFGRTCFRGAGISASRMEQPRTLPAGWRCHGKQTLDIRRTRPSAVIEQQHDTSASRASTSMSGSRGRIA